MKKILYSFVIFILISTVVYGIDKKAESYFHFLKFSDYMGKYEKKGEVKYLEMALKEITEAYNYNKEEPYLFITELETEIELFKTVDALKGVLNEIKIFEKKHPDLADLHKVKAILFDKLSKLSTDSKERENYSLKSLKEKESYLKKVKVYPPFNMDVGMYYFRKNDFKKAAKFFNPLAEKKSNEGIYATLFLGEIYYRIGEYKKSLEMIDWYSSFFGDSPNLCRIKINDYIGLKKYDKAAICYIKLLKITNDEINDKLGFAEFLIKYIKDCKEAIKVLNGIKEKIKSSNAQYDEFLRLSFLAYDCLGKKVEAFKFLKSLVSGNGNFNLAVKYADYCYQLGNYREALNVYLNLFNSLKEKGKKRALFSYVTDKLTYLLYITNDYKDILDILKSLDVTEIKQFPYGIYFESYLYLKKYEALSNLIDKLLGKVNSRKLQDMFKFYKKIVAFHKTLNYVKWEDFDRFMKEFETFKKERWLYFASTYYRFLDKRGEFLKYLDSHKNLLDKKTYLGFKSDVLLNLRKYKELKELAGEINKMKPENSSDYNNFGYILIESGVNVEKGIKYVKRALKDSPFNPLFLDSLAWGYYKEGEYKKAYENIKKAIDFGGNAPEIYEHAGDIAFRLKIFSDALKYYKNALSLSYFSETTKRLKKKISEIKKPVLLKGARHE